MNRRLAHQLVDPLSGARLTLEVERAEGEDVEISAAIGVAGSRIDVDDASAASGYTRSPRKRAARN